MKLIIGLGNPEDKYAGTRHNLGFEVVDKLANSLQSTVYSKQLWKTEDKFRSVVCKLEAAGIILVKPQTYMNNSGISAGLLAAYYKIPATDIIVIHDDLDLLLRHIKIRLGGAAAGHRGVESIIAGLGTDKFVRVRLGIGPDSRTGTHFSAEKFVLEAFLPNERSEVKRMVKKAALAIQMLLEQGLEAAQGKYNQ